MKNQTGVTDKEVVIANASDLTGPIPGLFQSAQDGVAAYIAHFNATSDLCGRELTLLPLDSKSSGAGDQQAYATTCEQAFAAVGSVSIYDSGGAQVGTDCALPDLRSVSLTEDRSSSPVTFPTQSVEVGVVSTANFDMIKKSNLAATRRGFLYLNIGGPPALAKSSETAAKVGFGVEMLPGIDTAEFNYGPLRALRAAAQGEGHHVRLLRRRHPAGSPTRGDDGPAELQAGRLLHEPDPVHRGLRRAGRRERQRWHHPDLARPLHPDQQQGDGST